MQKDKIGVDEKETLYTKFNKIMGIRFKQNDIS